MNHPFITPTVVSLHEFRAQQEHLPCLQSNSYYWRMTGLHCVEYDHMLYFLFPHTRKIVYR